MSLICLASHIFIFKKILAFIRMILAGLAIGFVAVSSSLCSHKLENGRMLNMF